MLVLGGFGLGAAVLTRHEYLLAAAGVILWVLLRERGSWSVRLRGVRPLVLGPAAAIAVWCSWNMFRFGDPLYTGFRPAFSFRGLYGYLASPTGSLVLYSPAVIPGLAALIRQWRAGASEARLFAWAALPLFLFYAALDDYIGTRSYGPRYLVPLIPLLIVPLAGVFADPPRLVRRRLLVACCTLSVLIQIPAALVDSSRVGLSHARPPVNAADDQWAWCPLWLNLEASVEMLPPNLRYMVGVEPPPPPAAAAGDDTSLGSRLAFSLDFWWLYSWYLGWLSRGLAVIAGIGPLAVAGCMFLLCWRGQ
jgi:hypothetical protein